MSAALAHTRQTGIRFYDGNVGALVEEWLFCVRPFSRVSGRLVEPDASDLRFGQPSGKGPDSP